MWKVLNFLKCDGEFVEEDKVVIAHKEVHEAVFGGCARKREEDGKEAKEDVENGSQGFGCAREDKETQTSSAKEIQRSEKRARQAVVEKYKICFDKIMRTLVDSEVVQKSALLMSLMVAQTGLIDELSARGIVGFEADQDIWFQAHKEFQVDIDAMDIGVLPYISFTAWSRVLDEGDRNGGVISGVYQVL
ncbi:unnamed protein product [Brassica rapa subsp. narinosa]|uniref:Uncharacterized protein n=2 Tax=Brassica TaxID=3705 RepID=M4CRN0_BRACM|nr:unnamed protein product [Brassica napus]